jgi:hypothetical protein
MVSEPLTDRQWGAYVAACAERDRYREALEHISQIADGYWCAHKDIATAALDVSNRGDV